MKIHSILFILISFPIILQSHLNAQSLSWKEAQKQRRSHFRFTLVCIQAIYLSRSSGQLDWLRI